MVDFNLELFKEFVAGRAARGDLIDHGGTVAGGAWCGCAVGEHLREIAPAAAYRELVSRDYEDYAKEIEQYFHDESVEIEYEGDEVVNVFELLNGSEPAEYAELDYILTEFH